MTTRESGFHWRLGLLFSCLLCLAGCFGSLDWTSSHAEKAEALSRQKKYDEAIEEYRLHMQERLALTNRPAWENPFFYLVLIGDIRLGTDDPQGALKEFEAAEAQHVDSYLVADRYRSVAAWYELQGRLKEAFEVLRSYRDRDPLLFDAMLDRIGKALTRQEDEELERQSSEQFTSDASSSFSSQSSSSAAASIGNQ